MSNGFLTWSGLDRREVGDSEERLADGLEEPEAAFSRLKILIHDHHGLEKRVDRGPKAKEVAECGRVIGMVGLKIRFDGLPGHLCL